MKYHEIKAIASDLDGTLTNSKKQITQHTKEIIQRTMHQGCSLILASGRPLAGISNVIEALELERLGGYVISYNGCLITEVKSNYTIYEKKLPENVIFPIYEFVKSLDYVKIATYQPGYIYSECEKDEYLEIEAMGCAIPVTVVKHLPDVIQNGIHKYVITGKPEVIPQTRKLIEKNFGNQVDTIISEPFFLEIVPKGVNKAVALDILAKYIGCESNQIAAFGDAENDVEMLEYVGVSFAMKNGCEKTKKAALHVIDSNDEDGVAKAIEKYILK